MFYYYHYHFSGTYFIVIITVDSNKWTHFLKKFFLFLKLLILYFCYLSMLCCFLQSWWQSFMLKIEIQLLIPPLCGLFLLVNDFFWNILLIFVVMEQTLLNCRAEVCKALGMAEDQCELSMGMSGDFEKAVCDTIEFKP